MASLLGAVFIFKKDQASTLMPGNGFLMVDSGALSSRGCSRDGRWPCSLDLASYVAKVGGIRERDTPHTSQVGFQIIMVLTPVRSHFISAALGSCGVPPGRQFGLGQSYPSRPSPATRSP